MVREDPAVEGRLSASRPKPRAEPPKPKHLRTMTTKRVVRISRTRMITLRRTAVSLERRRSS